MSKVGELIVGTTARLLSIVLGFNRYQIFVGEDRRLRMRAKTLPEAITIVKSLSVECPKSMITVIDRLDVSNALYVTGNYVYTEGNFNLSILGDTEVFISERPKSL
jgi:hypothetical protein